MSRCVKITLVLAVMFFVVISVAKPIASTPKNFKMGTRIAASLLLNGGYPKHWEDKAGGGAPVDKLVWPLPGRKLGRGFGSDNGRHLAIDVTAPKGTPVRAAARGVVGYANDGVKGYGKMMLVLHPGGLVTLYAHLNSYKINSGGRVSRGQIIATTGNTGLSRGPHLHFALLHRGKALDPAPLMVDMPVRYPRISSLMRPFL